MRLNQSLFCCEKVLHYFATASRCALTPLFCLLPVVRVTCRARDAVCTNRLCSNNRLRRSSESYSQRQLSYLALKSVSRRDKNMDVLRSMTLSSRCPLCGRYTRAYTTVRISTAEMEAFYHLLGACQMAIRPSMSWTKT